MLDYTISAKILDEPISFLISQCFQKKVAVEIAKINSQQFTWRCFIENGFLKIFVKSLENLESYFSIGRPSAPVNGCLCKFQIFK